MKFGIFKFLSYMEHYFAASFSIKYRYDFWKNHLKKKHRRQYNSNLITYKKSLLCVFTRALQVKFEHSVELTLWKCLSSASYLNYFQNFFGEKYFESYLEWNSWKDKILEEMWDGAITSSVSVISVFSCKLPALLTLYPECWKHLRVRIVSDFVGKR